VDTHLHLEQATADGRFSSAGFVEATEAGLGQMDRLGMAWAVLLPTPQTSGRPLYYEFEELLPVVPRHPQPFVFLGGGSLNVIILEAMVRGEVDDALRQGFIARAEAIAAAAAAGFGEMAALHFGFPHFPPHLHFSLQAVFPMPVAKRPLDYERRLRPEWLALITDFLDRFLWDGDESYPPGGKTPRRGTSGPHPVHCRTLAGGAGAPCQP